MNTYTTEERVRAAFWDSHPELTIKPRSDLRHHEDVRQNQQPADIRMAFVDFVDQLARDGAISSELANSVTL